jgi:hypothetical protein
MAINKAWRDYSFCQSSGYLPLVGLVAGSVTRSGPQRLHRTMYLLAGPRLPHSDIALKGISNLIASRVALSDLPADTTQLASAFAYLPDALVVMYASFEFIGHPVHQVGGSNPIMCIFFFLPFSLPYQMISFYHFSRPYELCKQIFAANLRCLAALTCARKYLISI